MTSPNSAGEVSVEVVADARGLAKSFRSEVEKAFKGLDFSKTIQDSIGTKPIKVPVEADTKALTSKLKAETAAAARAAKTTVKVNVDVDKKGANGALGGLSKSVLSGISDGLASIGAHASQAAGSVLGLGGSLAGAANTASGPVGVVVTALAGLAVAIGGVAAAATVAVPAIATLAGAVAALPGLLAGAGAGFGTLALGFQGISDAFKKKPGGGGGGGGGEDPASRARRIAGAERGVEAARRGIAAASRALQSANRGLEQAERGVADAQEQVADAQKRALQAQLAVNRARLEAKEDIEDLNRELRGAALSEEDAALRVTEALRELNKAKESGVLPDIQRADLEYRQAQLALEDAKDSTEDLGKAAAEANAKGVEGSDKVQDALADQVEANRAVRDAVRGVADAQVAVIDAQNGVLAANDALKSSYDGLKSAQDSLAEAQKKAAPGGGGGGALADVVKLAPAAQKFVDAIKALKPAFEDLRLDVQQRLFAGLDKTVTNLGKAWIPALRTTLGSYADTFNGFFKNLGKNVAKPQFIEDLQVGAEGARKGFEKIGEAVSGPLVEAFGTLSAASAPFLEALGGEIGTIVRQFSAWVQAGEKSGALKEFFKSATASMHDIFTTGKTVASIIGKLISIIVGRELKGASGKTPLQQANEALQKLSDWLDDPAHQEGLRQFFEKIIDGFEKIGAFVKKIDGWIDKIKALKTAITGGDENVSSASGAAGGKAVTNLTEAARKAGLTPAAGTTAGSDVGRATGDGFFAGLKERLGGFSIAGLLWEGPNSLIGRIKSGLGIASPSTVTMQIGRDLVNGLVQGITETLELLQGKAGEIKRRVLDGIGKTTDTLTQKGRELGTSLRNGLQATAGAVQSKASELKTRISNAFSNAGTLLTSRGQSIANSLRNGINAIATNVGITASNLKIRIQNAFSNAGTLLYNAGYNTVLGLWNGIASLGGWLYAKVANFVRNNIVNPVQNFLKIGSPSRLMFEMGAFTSEGLALGMESEARRVEQAADAVAAAALPDVTGAGVDLFGAADAALSSSLAVADQKTMQASWAPGMTGDPLLDAIRSKIKFSFGGRVEAALNTA